MAPAVMCLSPQRASISVVLPEPLAPISEVQLPVGTSNEIFSKENEPARTESCWTVSIENGEWRMENGELPELFSVASESDDEDGGDGEGDEDEGDGGGTC